MAVIDSAGSGDWHTPATWVGGAVPGTGDTGNIKAGHTVTISTAVAAIQRINVIGALAINNNITLDNSGYAYINVEGTGTVTTTATAAAPIYISSAGGATPSNRWRFYIRHNVGAAARALSLDGIVMSGNQWSLGSNVSSSTGYLLFNNNPTMVMLRPTPIAREIALNEHLIDGRSYGRVYPKAKAAGRCTVRGYLPYGASTQYWAILEGLITLNQRVSLITDLVHMPLARIESLRWGEVKGNNLPFTMVLVEDL